MQKPWLAQYQPGVPTEIDASKHASIPDLFIAAAQRFRDRPAVINMGAALSYGDLDRLSRDFAAFLQHDLHLPRGSRVAVMLPNLLQYPVVTLGALRAGMVVVNVNPLYKARELEHQLKDSGAEAIVILANFAHTLDKVIRHTRVRHVVLTRVGDLLTPVKRLIVNMAIKHVKRMEPAFSLPGHTSLRNALASGRRKHFSAPTLTHSDLAFLQYTGGTTGIAKGAMLTHGNLLANIEQAGAWISQEVKEGEEVILTALPLYHIFSLTGFMIFSAIGATSILVTNPRDMKGLIKTLHRYPVTCMTGVNTLFNAMLNHPEFARLDFSRWKFALGGGMAVSQSVAERWIAMTGSKLVEAYGLTEASPCAIANPMNTRGFTGVIGFPISSTEAEVRDEHGQPVQQGTAGELFVRGPQIMQGYWNQPEETAKVLGDDRFLATGDVAVMDEQGCFKLVDRKKDMILVSGFNVYPNEIEDVVMSHPDVLEAACVGIPDERSGEAVKLVVVKRHPHLTVEALIAHCRASLTNYKIPQRIEFRMSLPKSPIGKILRRELRH
jgi:long-chain acyl-CoA synthetase